MLKILKVLGASLAMTLLKYALLASLIWLIFKIFYYCISSNNSAAEIFFGIAVPVVFFATFISVLYCLGKKCESIVFRINQTHDLVLNEKQLLGWPGAFFIAFDQKNRKLAICLLFEDNYQIYDFSYILNWEVRYQEDAHVTKGVMEYNVRHSKSKVHLRLHVANPEHPTLDLYMSYRSAEQWSARLNALYQG